MADDTRLPQPEKEDLSREALTVSPEHVPFSGTQWQDIKAPENANMMAGGTQNTAGGKAPEISIGNAFKDGLKWDDFTTLHKRPCVRDGLLTGIGGGAALGGVRAIFGAAIYTSCSTAVFSFCAFAPLMYQYCMYKRTAEREGMMRAVEIMNNKDVEKKAREALKEKQKGDRRAAKEKEQDAQFSALHAKANAGSGASGVRPWWKVW